jgi:hypothetical protein
MHYACHNVRTKRERDPRALTSVSSNQFAKASRKSKKPPHILNREFSNSFQIGSELAELIEIWPDLPQPVKAEILRLAKTQQDTAR